jgi:multidrug efflux pump subunit AcrB
MKTQLSTAPSGMKNGWFVSDLEFYELQRTLYEGTIWSILISMVLALFVLAFVTLNPIISFYAILSVGATIVITIAGLIMIGWKLNVLESIAISTAIGK